MKNHRIAYLVKQAERKRAKRTHTHTETNALNSSCDFPFLPFTLLPSISRILCNENERTTTTPFGWMGLNQRANICKRLLFTLNRETNEISNISIKFWSRTFGVSLHWSVAEVHFIEYALLKRFIHSICSFAFFNSLLLGFPFTLTFYRPLRRSLKVFVCLCIYVSAAKQLTDTVVNEWFICKLYPLSCNRGNFFVTNDIQHESIRWHFWSNTIMSVCKRRFSHVNFPQWMIPIVLNKVFFPFVWGKRQHI